MGAVPRSRSNGDAAGSRRRVNGTSASNGKSGKSGGADQAGSGKLFRMSEVPAWSHNAFILSGYRGQLSAWDCVRSIFEWHNESLNIWTHIAETFFCLYVWLTHTQVVKGMQEIEVLSDDQFEHFTHFWAIDIFCLGWALKCACSAAAHCFSCASERMYHWWFYVDYCTISLYAITSGVTETIFSSRGFAEHESEVKLLLITLTLVVINAFFVMCASRTLTSKRVQPWLRLGSYAAIYVVAHAVVWHRMWFTEEHVPSDWYWKCHLYLFAFAGVVSSVKVPERWMPGWCDYVGTGHQIMHVACGVGSWVQFMALSLDVEQEPLFTRVQAEAYVHLGNACLGSTLLACWGLLLVALVGGYPRPGEG